MVLPARLIVPLGFRAKAKPKPRPLKTLIRTRCRKRVGELSSVDETASDEESEAGSDSREARIPRVVRKREMIGNEVDAAK